MLPGSERAVTRKQKKAALSVCTLPPEGEVRPPREEKNTCKHGLYATGLAFEDERRGVLGLSVQGNEMLAVACDDDDCQDIKLISLDTLVVTLAYKSKARPWILCAGDPGRVWVGMRNKQVVELDSTQLKFEQTGRKFTVKHGEFYGLCFIPEPYNALVFTEAQGNSCVCMTVRFEHSAQELWRLTGTAGGSRPLCPRGVVFSPQRRVLLLADQNSKVILVLDPGTGMRLQTLAMPQQLGKPLELCLIGEYLFVRSNRGEERKISRFAITKP